METNFYIAAEERSEEEITALQRSLSLKRSTATQETEEERLREQYESAQKEVKHREAMVREEKEKHEKLITALRAYQESVEVGTPYQRMYSELSSLVSQYR